MQWNTRKGLKAIAQTAVAMASLGSLVGCQVDVGGQTLPSPWYLDDDVQYFAPGPEFLLTNEAAAMEEYSARVRAGRGQ